MSDVLAAYQSQRLPGSSLAIAVAAKRSAMLVRRMLDCWGCVVMGVIVVEVVIWMVQVRMCWMRRED